MNKKFIIIIGILLGVAEISFAVVLDNYGSAVGTADVVGPEFYLGSVSDETFLVNEKPDNCEDFKIAGTYRTFKTKELNGVDFDYSPKVQFSVRAKGVETTASQNLTLRWGYFDDEGETIPHYLCSTNISLTENMGNYTSDFIQCSGTPTNVKRFFYEFEKEDQSYDYTISKCTGEFYTKIELSK